MDAVFQEEKKALDRTEKIIEHTAQELEAEIADQNQIIDNYVCADYTDRQNLALLRADTSKKQERVDELRSYQDSPYFGRMDLDLEDEDATEIVYVGKSEIMVNHEYLVSDWRSPIGQYFYMKSERRFHAGEVDYVLQLRRAIEIKNGQLVSYQTEFDGETVSLEGDVIDPFLLTVLKDKRRQNRLTDIIKTIQSNQNDIIRRPRNESFILQGCAGSGKTMILLHRLSYLLFNNRDISTDSIKIITPNSLFDAHINELSNELGLDHIERNSVEEFYVSLIKGFSRKMNVSAEVHSEKNLEPKLLKELYSEEYFDDTCTHYDGYWKDTLAQIEALNIKNIAARLSYNYSLPSEYTYEAYNKLDSDIHYLERHVAEELVNKNQLKERVENFQKKVNSAEEDEKKRLENLSEIAHLTKEFLEKSITKQRLQLEQSEEREEKVASWKKELQELTEISNSKHEELEVIRNDSISLMEYHSVINRTDPAARGVLSALSEQVEKIRRLEESIRNTTIYNFRKKNRLKSQLASEIKFFNRQAANYVSSHQNTESEGIMIIDQNIAELQQRIRGESKQLEEDKQTAITIKREKPIFTACLELFNDSLYPDFRDLDISIYQDLPKDLKLYEYEYEKYKEAVRHTSLAKREFSEINAEYQQVQQRGISKADLDVLNESIELVRKLRLGDISRNIMLKDMLDAYRAYRETYRKTNYRHKLYIKLLFCYLYYRRLPGNFSFFINIDEAQDISKSEYRLMRMIFGSRCVFNLYGDVNQLVYEYKGIGNWSDIAQYITGTVFSLNENYRNTLQITNYCNKEFGGDVYPIGISGDDVSEISFSKAVTMICDAKKEDPELRAAIIFRYGHSGIVDALQKKVDEQEVSWFEIDNDKVSILSVENAKGLEFDVVVAIVDRMTTNEKYISYTRALNSLYVVRDQFEYAKHDEDGAEEDVSDEELLIEDDNDVLGNENQDVLSIEISTRKTLINEDTKETVIPQIDAEAKNNELLSAVNLVFIEAFGEDHLLTDEQEQVVQLLGGGTKLACTAPSGWKKSIILFALAKIKHNTNGKQSILTAESHLQENELVLAEKLGLKAGSITRDMPLFLADFKKEKYDIIFVPYDFFAYDTNIREFISYFAGNVEYWGIDHPSEEIILWDRIKQTVDELNATPFLMSKTGFEGLDLDDYQIVDIVDDSELNENLINTLSFASAEDKKVWLTENAAKELWGQGLVYCETEDECKEISKILRKMKIKAEAYIGVTDSKNTERINYLSNSFSKGGLLALVTTHDIGKNLSNSNIRFIVHYSVPKEKDLYAQHISQIGKIAEDPIVFDLKP